jgi:hypothetical protein
MKKYILRAIGMLLMIFVAALVMGGIYTALDHERAASANTLTVHYLNDDLFPPLLVAGGHYGFCMHYEHDFAYGIVAHVKTYVGTVTRQNSVYTGCFVYTPPVVHGRPRSDGLTFWLTLSKDSKFKNLKGQTSEAMGVTIFPSLRACQRVEDSGDFGGVPGGKNCNVNGILR